MAKNTTGTKRSRKNELRAKAAQKRRRQSMMLWAGIAAVVVLIGGIFFVNYWSSRPVGEEVAFASQGNIHIADFARAPIAYNSTPPTSGPHYETIARWDVYEETLPYERVLHNLEDGGVAIYYQCEDGCPELVTQLADVVNPYIDQGRHVIMVPNAPDQLGSDGQPLHQDMGSQIALAAWQRLDKFDELDPDRVRAFIERYEGIDHHQ